MEKNSNKGLNLRRKNCNKRLHKIEQD